MARLQRRFPSEEVWREVECEFRGMAVLGAISGRTVVWAPLASTAEGPVTVHCSEVRILRADSAVVAPAVLSAVLRDQARS